MATAKKTTEEKKASAKTSSMKDLYSASDAASGTAVAAAKTDKELSSQAYRILVKPLVTEKASVMGALNKYAFAVAIDANKVEVAKAIKSVYGIAPKSVNMIRVEGKQTRHGRTMGKRKDWKKAVVTLPEGKTIQVYEGV